MSLQRFALTRFVEASEGREALCTELAFVLSESLRGAGHFHKAVNALVAELKAVGHDLTSFDESDDMQAWCPDYARQSGPGLVVTFTAPDHVEVQWSTQ